MRQIDNDGKKETKIEKNRLKTKVCDKSDFGLAEDYF